MLKVTYNVIKRLEAAREGKTCAYPNGLVRGQREQVADKKEKNVEESFFGKVLLLQGKTILKATTTDGANTVGLREGFIEKKNKFF